MHTLTRLTLALAAGVIVLPALAVERAPLTPALAAHAPSAMPASTMTMPVAGSKPKASGDVTTPGTPSVNPLRAYPPSCAAYPLPNKASGPTWSGTIPLLASTSTGQYYTESATITVWRVPCSSSGSAPRYNPEGAANAMMLLRIERSEANDGETARRPYTPFVQAAQGNIGDFETDPKTLVRLALEPNTVISEFAPGTTFIDSTTFVLENYATDTAGYFSFRDALKLRINPNLNGIPPLDFDIPAYEPEPDTYPAAFAPRALDGYAAAQWVSGSDGLLIQVSEQNAGSKMTRQLIFDLLTTDLDGNPWWLVGNAAFEVGTKSLDVEAIYLGPELSHEPWGKVNVQMPSCGELEVTFTPNEDLPAPVPSLSGLTTFTRLFDANGMVCE